jgi:drug/metabolite transporter (DMT)-like permease
LEVIISFGFVFLIPIYFIEYQMDYRIIPDKNFFIILFYVVLFPGLASFIFWIKGVSLIGANRAGVFLHMMPILSAIMAMIIFNEKFMFYHMLGTIFILIGILLSNRKIENA